MLSQNIVDTSLNIDYILKLIVLYSDVKEQTALRITNKAFSKASTEAFFNQTVILKAVLSNMSISKLICLDEKHHDFKKRISQTLVNQKSKFFYPFQKEWLQETLNSLGSAKNLNIMISHWFKNSVLAIEDKLNALFFIAVQKDQPLTVKQEFVNFLAQNCNQSNLTTVAYISQGLNPEQIEILFPILLEALDNLEDNAIGIAGLSAIRCLAQKFNSEQVSALFSKMMDFFDATTEILTELPLTILSLVPSLTSEQISRVYTNMEAIIMFILDGRKEKYLDKIEIKII